MTFRTVTACLLVLLLALAACSPDKGDAAGRYTATTGDTGITLTLGENGRGTWSTDTDEIPFKWSRPAPDQLWLHTREGGVIRGRMVDGRLSLALPGADELVFERE